MRGFVLALFCISAACAQDDRRVFHLTDFTSAGGAQEIVTTLRNVAQIQQVTYDSSTANIIVVGTPDELLLAEWLIPKLDVPPDGNVDPQKCAVGGNMNDLLEVVELKNAPAYATLQEMLTTLRTVADIKLAYQISAPRILVYRTDTKQMALAEYLVFTLDQPADARQKPVISRIPMPAPASETILIYGLVHINSPARLQGLMTTLRTILGVVKEYRLTAPKVLVIRGNANTLRMAEWLIPRLDTVLPSAGSNEVAVTAGSDDLVHVFYLKQVTSMSGISNIFQAVGGAPDMSKSYYYSTAPPALIVRGTASQIKIAGQIIADTDK